MRVKCQILINKRKDRCSLSQRPSWIHAPALLFISTWMTFLVTMTFLNLFFGTFSRISQFGALLALFRITAHYYHLLSQSGD